MRMKHFILPFLLPAQGLLISGFSWSHNQSHNQYSTVFETSTASPFPATPQWRKTPGKMFAAFCANAPHNWAYFKRIQPQLKFLKETFAIPGIGIGDIHILNIGDIELADGSRAIGLIDVDDGGPTSLFADVSRAIISNQVSPYKVPVKDLWNAYLLGLRGEKNDEPQVIIEVQSHSHKGYLNLQKKYLAKMIEHKTFSVAAKVQSLSEADPLTQEIYQKSHWAFEETLNEVTVLDRGFKIKKTGGSQGIPRFWYLIEDGGKKSIIEFKTLGEPAMEFFQHQPPPEVRVKELIDLYRPQKNTYGIYKFVDGGQYQFIARERLQPFLHFLPEGSEKPAEIKDGQEMYLYLLNKVGLWQAELGVGDTLAAALTQSESGTLKEFEKIIDDYIEIIQMEQSQSILLTKSGTK